MRLKDLEQVVADLRARGVHPLTEVVIRDGSTTTEIETVEVGYDCVVVRPAYAEDEHD